MTPEQAKIEIEDGRNWVIGAPTFKTENGHVYDTFRYHVSGEITDEELLAGLVKMVKKTIGHMPGTIYWRILPEVVRRSPNRSHGYCRLVIA